MSWIVTPKNSEETGGQELSESPCKGVIPGVLTVGTPDSVAEGKFR